MDFRQFAFDFLSLRFSFAHHFDIDYYSFLYERLLNDGGHVWSVDSGRRRVFRCCEDSDVVDYCESFYPSTAFSSGLHERRVRLGSDFWDCCVAYTSAIRNL